MRRRPRDFACRARAGADRRPPYCPTPDPSYRCRRRGDNCHRSCAFARKTYDSYHHGVGTCKMGPASDNMAVVDQRLRVHGMQNLWVGDASIMPVVSRANTNLTSIMIGERLADFVQEIA